MFNNKKDPLVDAVKSVMAESNLYRQVETAVNNHYGITSRKAIPHEHLAEYDALLAEAYKQAMDEKELSPKQKRLAMLGNVAGEGGQKHKIDEPDLKAARKGHAHKVGLEEKLTKDMSAGDVISDFVHSKDPKFEGKSKKERQKMALGAYYGMHPEKSRKEKSKQIDEVLDTPARQMTALQAAQQGQRNLQFGFSKKRKDYEERYRKAKADEKPISPSQKLANVEKYAKAKLTKESILEEIRSNLEEQLVDAYESGDSQIFENFVLSLTEEQREILGLNEFYGVALRAGQAIASSPVGRAIGNRISSALSSARSTGGRPPPIDGGALRSTNSPARLALPKPTGTAVAKPPSAPPPATGTGVSSSSGPGTAVATRPTTPPATTSVPRTGTTPPATAASPKLPSVGGNRASTLGKGATIGAGAAANLATSADPTNTGPDNDPGGRSYDAADDNDPGGRSYDAAPKPAARQSTPAQRPSAPATQSAPRQKPDIPRTPDLDKRGAVGGSGGFTRRQSAELGFTTMDEQTQIRESLESFLRNRFLKG